MATLSLVDASAVLVSLVRGERTWAHVGPAYEDVSDGDVVFRTRDGWVIVLHTSYDELKHVAGMTAPDGRTGDPGSWQAEAVAMGRRTGDPMDGLTDAGFDYLEKLALEAPASAGPHPDQRS